MTYTGNKTMYLLKTTKGGGKKLKKQQIERKLKTYTGKVGVEGIPNTHMYPSPSSRNSWAR